ncbi:MAG: beta-lactamase family protein [Flavobacteriales bacterium]|nr:beta-lactamase family protein [Flavobacteriales bacterium]
MRIPSLLSALALLASTHAQTPADFEAAMKEHFTADAPGGAAIVSKGGTVLYEGAIGMADMAKGEALTAEDQFRIGSVSKQFAAVAIMQLAEQGKLQLDDEIQKYVDFPRKEKPITITHLLTHSSGIPSFTDLPLYQPEAYAKDIELTEIIALFADLHLEFEPGTRFSYSNSGYLLLTAIVERASGLSWTAYAESTCSSRPA